MQNIARIILIVGILYGASGGLVGPDLMNSVTHLYVALGFLFVLILIAFACGDDINSI